MYQVKLSSQAKKDHALLGPAGLSKRAKALIDILQKNPYQNPPAYEKLTGNLKGLYSRRLNQQHRLVYEVREREKTVVVLSLWSHYATL